METNSKELQSKLVEKKSAESYRFGKVIGEGSFSTVYLAKDIESGKEYASKLPSNILIALTYNYSYIHS